MRLNYKIVSCLPTRQKALVEFLKKQCSEGEIFETEVFVFDVDYSVINGSTMVLEGENLALIIRLLQLGKKVIFITANVYQESCNGRDFSDICMKKRIETPIIKALSEKSDLEKSQNFYIFDQSGRTLTHYSVEGIPTTSSFINSELPVQYQSRAARALILAFFSVYHKMGLAQLRKTIFYKKVQKLSLPKTQDTCHEYLKQIEK